MVTTDSFEQNEKIYGDREEKDDEKNEKIIMENESDQILKTEALHEGCKFEICGKGNFLDDSVLNKECINIIINPI